VLRCAVDREGGALKLSSLPLVWALRDGGEACLPIQELVPGDVIILTKGDMVRERK
jgi:magnesium-transporting ATPase (P-type)